MKLSEKDKYIFVITILVYFLMIFIFNQSKNYLPVFLMLFTFFYYGFRTWGINLELKDYIVQNYREFIQKNKRYNPTHVYSTMKLMGFEPDEKILVYQNRIKHGYLLFGIQFFLNIPLIIIGILILN